MSNANPLGYGHPLVGLFRSSGEPIIFGSSDNSRLPNVFVSDHLFILKSCEIEDDEEDGITADLEIEMNHQGLVDSRHFHHSNKLVLRTGYLVGHDVIFGDPYHLIVLNKRVKYGDVISLNLELVDEKIYISKMVDHPSDHDDNLNRIEKSVLEAEGYEIDQEKVDKIKDAYDRMSLNEIFEELNKIRFNIQKRYGVYRYSFGGGQYNSIEDLREAARKMSTTYPLIDISPGLRTKAREIRTLSDMQIHERYGRRMANKVGKFLIRNAQNKRNFTDFYGFTFCDIGEKKWIDHLRDLGLLKIARERHGGNTVFAGLFYENGRFSESKIDEFIAAILDEWVFKRVKSDMNKSSINNLEYYLRSLLGGPHLLKDDGDGQGLHTEKRNVDKPAYSVLFYKGGPGDLLEVEIETNYEEPEFSSAEVSYIDPETGDEVYSTHMGYNQTDGVMTGGPQAYVDAAKIAIDNGRPVPPLSDFDRYYTVKPFREYSTESPAYYKEDGMPVVAVDRTAIVKRLPPVSFKHAPLAIEEVLAEIDNRRSDVNLKRIMANATILGNPNIKSGFVFVLSGINPRFAGRYYALSVTHSIDVTSGYKIKLVLGKIPVQESRVLVTKKVEKEFDKFDYEWRYDKASQKIFEYIDGEPTGREEQVVVIGDEDTGLIKVDGRPIWFDPERNMIYDSGYDPTYMEQKIHGYSPHQSMLEKGYDPSKPRIVAEPPTRTVMVGTPIGGVNVVKRTSSELLKLLETLDNNE